MRKATPRLAINKIVLGLKCDEATFDDALRDSNVLSQKWEGAHCNAVSTSVDPTRTREERNLNEDEHRVHLIIARYMKPVAISVKQPSVKIIG